MDTHNDNNLNRNNPHSIYATEEESLSDLEIAQNDCSEYQMKYMAEKAKIEAIKEVIKFGRSIESENGTATMLLNKLENIINLK